MERFLLDAAASAASAASAVSGASGASGAEAAAGNSTMMVIMQYGLLALVIVGLYFLFIRPQRKREKEAQEMRSNIEIGDEIVTAGGMIGRVVSVRDDTLVIETGTDRNKVRIARWAVQANNSLAEEKDIKDAKETK